MNSFHHEAYVTLATNDRYGYGALTLAASLRNVETKRKLVAVVTPSVGEQMHSCLLEMFNEVICVDPLNSNDPTHLALLKRPELGITFTKIQVWTLTQYTKCVFLDADTLVLSNVDELFDREEFSAAPDCGWPDLFNSGVFVFHPNMETFEKLLTHAVNEGSFDGGDQGLLNSYFKNWRSSDIKKHLPFLYNMAANITYSYAPAFLRSDKNDSFGTQAKIVHFLGSNKKPWDHSYDIENHELKLSEDLDKSYYFSIPYIKLWWKLYYKLVHGICFKKDIQLGPKVAKKQESNSTTSTTIQAPINIPTQSTNKKATSPSTARKESWENGHADYMGADRFSNIQAHLDSIINKNYY